MTRMVLAGLMLTSVTHSTAEDWAPPTANKKDIQDVLFGRYQLENKKSSDEWKKLQSVLAPGAGSGASLAAYKLTNKNEAEIKKILDSYGFKPTYAKTGSKKFLKFVRKTPVRGFLFVVTVYEGVVSAYNFYESPNAVGKPDLRRLEFPEESLPIVTSGSENAHQNAVFWRVFIHRHLGFVLGGFGAVVALIVYILLRKKGVLR